jgi:co-chaperonin GroES (HSP10)
MTVQRIYIEGWQPTDFSEMKPGLLLIAPIVPAPKSQTRGGIFVPEKEVDKIPGTAALMYGVVALDDKLVGDLDNNPMNVDVGDVVVVRNAMVDPIHPNTKTCVVDVKHVLTKVRAEVVAPDPVEPARPLCFLCNQRPGDPEVCADCVSAPASPPPFRGVALVQPLRPLPGSADADLEPPPPPEAA